MPNPVRQIIGSFEDIGKDVLKQTAQVPKDIVGKALESLGTTTTKQQGQQNPKAQQEPLDKAIARAALEQLAAPAKPKELSVWEIIQQESAEKKEQQQKQAAQSAQQIPQAKGKRPRGDLYGLKAKKNPAEMSRNVRQD